MSFDDIIAQLAGNGSDDEKPSNDTGSVTGSDTGSVDSDPSDNVTLDYVGGYRDAIAFTRALTAGDGDGAVEIYGSSGSEMVCALAQLLDDTIVNLSRITDVDPDMIYTQILFAAERHHRG